MVKGKDVMPVMHNREQTDLVARLKNGERGAFDTLVQVYQGKGFAVAYGIIGNVEDAKDVLQEAFIKMYMNVKSFRGDCALSTWFYRIVVNCSWDLLRKKKRERKVFREPIIGQDHKEPEAVDIKNSPKKLLMKTELGKQLDMQINKLSQKQKICFILKYKNDMSILEIAQVLDSSVSTVKVHLFRAVKKLRESLLPYLTKGDRNV